MSRITPLLVGLGLAACQPAPKPNTPVLDSFIHHREVGRGRPIVLLHGNPTSSYVWRNVMPELASRGRCLAPDLIGMGQSGKPDIGYRFADHARYLDAWLGLQDLHDAVLVGYDWGGVLAIDWARRHPERVRGLVFFETMLQEIHLRDMPPVGQELFRAIRTPGIGEKMVLEENLFLEKSLGNGVKHGLSEHDRAEYYAPYPDPASRRPLLAWPRELPIDGEPPEIMTVIRENADFLAHTPALPKLLLTFEGAPLSPATVTWAKETIPNLRVVALGKAGHHAPEDAPGPIAKAIEAWLP